ncbi:MAG: hypothetical protein ACJ77V_09750 [Chloroflexota bacterium]
MRPIKLGGRLRAVMLCTAIVAGLGLPAAVSADTTGGENDGASVTIGTAVHVTGKLVAVVDVSFTCDPFLIFDWQTGTMIESTVGHLSESSVTLSQVQGRSVVTAFGEFGERQNEIVVCDGATLHTRSVPIMALTVPWKSGAAIASARVRVYSDGFESRDFGDSGTTVVKLGK